MSYVQLKEKIKSKELSPVYLLYGTESYLIEDIQREIVSAVLDPADMDFNLSVFDMKEVSVQEALETAQTITFFGGKRVVVLKESFFLSTQKEKTEVEHDLGTLEDYVSNPAEDSVIVIVAPYEKLDERKKIVKAVKKFAEVLHADAFNERILNEWLDEQALHCGVSISRDAKERLIQLVGGNLMLMSKEMEKFSLYVGEGGQVDDSVVDLLTVKTLEQDVFSLVDHVVNKRLAKALQIFYDLLQQKEEPIKLLTLLARQFRIIYHVKVLSSQGMNQKEMASELKLHPYAVKIAMKQAQAFDYPQLSNAIGLFAETDYKIKSGTTDKKLAFELLMLQLQQ